MAVVGAAHDFWAGFCAELEARTDHLASELFASWKDLSTLTAAQGEAFASAGTVSDLPATPEALQSFFTGVAQVLLVDPLAEYGQRRPLLRSLSAIEEHESVVGDLLRGLPKVARLSGRDLVQLAGAAAGPYSRLWRGWRRKPGAVQFRDAVSDHLLGMVLARAPLDGAFRLLLAESALHLLVPWQTSRRALLATLARSGYGRVDIDSARKWWSDRVRRREERAAFLLARYRDWAESVSRRLARALLRGPRPSSPHTRARRTDEHQRHLGFWSRQQRAVRAVLDLEIHLTRLARETTSQTIDGLRALDVEHTELLDELDAAIAWLQNWPEVESPDLFPPPKARLLSSDERVAEWLRAVSAKAREELPVAIETVEPRQPLPGWRKPWRDLEPARVFLSALAHTGAPTLAVGLREAEAAHRAIVREIERAREVVSFGFETSRSEGASGEAFAREALDNAASLLSYEKGVTPDIRPAAEAAAAQAEAAVLLESDIAFEQGRIGLLAHVTRQRGGQAVRQLRALAGQTLRAGSERLWAGVRHVYRWALLKIGWLAAPQPQVQPVVRRPGLGETLEVQLHGRALPMIYRRLFRLEPVEDPRFLVGREAEMAGFSDALSRWEAGRGASVIVIGARGSGKTSLINCAVAGVFSGRQVVCGQFSDRLTTPAQIEDYLRRLTRTPPSEDLVAALRAGRRVVMIEELERTFLRTMNGFDALRALLDLMYSTAAGVLWVFSMNETAYRYLDAVLGLGRHFSHRINAMSVRQEDLTNAILQRHGLSGLRLEFAPLPERDPRVSGVRRVLGFEQDPQRIFLDALYEQSEGIFRAAFELWQGSIERVEGGVVHMRQPLSPDYRPLMAEMTIDDCFVLKVVLQHGSLTAGEIAEVLTISREASQRQMERLQLLEVLEPEPAGPGVRVRPEAGRLVRETLSRRNLL
jgi:hypothetical protein